MSELFVLTSTAEPAAGVLPALGLLLHTVRTGQPGPDLVTASGADVVLVDARRDLVEARRLCRLLHSLDGSVPVIAVVTEGGLAAVTADWRADDVVVQTAGPAEVEARIRLAVGRHARTAPAPSGARAATSSYPATTTAMARPTSPSTGRRRGSGSSGTAPSPSGA